MTLIKVIKKANSKDMKSKKRKRIDPKAKDDELFCEKARRRSAEKECAELQESLDAMSMKLKFACENSMSKNDELSCEKARRRNAEKECAKLQEQLDAMSKNDELSCEKARRRSAEKECAELQESLDAMSMKLKFACENSMSKNDELSCEKARRRNAEKECAKLQEQLDAMSKNDELSCEKARRRNAEKECAKLQEQLDAMSKNDELSCEKARRRSAEKECAKLQEQLDAMSKNDELSCEKARRRSAEKECAKLQEQLDAMSKNDELSCEKARRRSAEKECAKLQEQLDAMSTKLLDLEGRMQMQKAVSGLSHGVSWQYEMDGGWEAFTPEGNEKTHQAYLDFLRGTGSQSATIHSGGVDRVVDFEQMQQAHMVTRKKRRIQISPGVPPQWVTATPDLLQQSNDLHSFYKEVTDDKIWDSLRYILQNTGHSWDQAKDCSCMRRAEVKSVHRIENMRL